MSYTHSENSENDESQLLQSLSMLEITQQHEVMQASSSIVMDSQEQWSLQMAAQSSNIHGDEVDEELPTFLDSANRAEVLAMPTAPPLDLDPEVLPPARHETSKDHLIQFSDGSLLLISGAEDVQTNSTDQQYQVEIKFDEISNERQGSTNDSREPTATSTVNKEMYAVITFDDQQETMEGDNSVE